MAIDKKHGLCKQGCNRLKGTQKWSQLCGSTNWSLLLDPQNRINSGLKKKVKTLLPSNKKVKLERGENNCSQDANYRKSGFQANLKKLGCNSLINAGMM